MAKISTLPEKLVPDLNDEVHLSDSVDGASKRLKVGNFPAAGGGVPSSRILTAGDGLTGGGDLTVDRTFDVALTADGQHGSRGGSALHMAATIAMNGFMSSADKTNHDILARAPQQASATASDTETSATDVLMDSMSITPGAGNYMAHFSATFDHDTTNESIFYSIYKNGVQIPHTERGFKRGGSAGDIVGGLATVAYITGVTGGQAIEIRWRTTAGTATVFERTFVLESKV